MEHSDPDAMKAVLDILAFNHIGDAAGLLGLLLGLIGFAVTIRQSWVAKTAAEAARDAAIISRNAVVTSDAVSEIAAALATMEEIKRLQRIKVWSVLLDRYSDLRRRLRSIKNRVTTLKEEHAVVLLSSLRHLGDVESQVEEYLQTTATEVQVTKLNRKVSGIMDKLSDVLDALKG